MAEVSGNNEVKGPAVQFDVDEVTGNESEPIVAGGPRRPSGRRPVSSPRRRPGRDGRAEEGEVRPPHLLCAGLSEAAEQLG